MYSVHEGKEDILFTDRLENISVCLPKSNFGELVLLPDFPVPDPDFIDNTFASPIDSPPLRKIALGKKNASILVSDSTRNVPTSSVLPRLLEELALGGIDRENTTLIVATGVHRPATEEEMSEIVGENFRGKIRIENHDPYSPENLVQLGTTSRGTPVEVNRFVSEADLRIAVGKVEPHEFAGFSGGRKSVLPGIASERTILVNHRPEMVLHPLASIGILEGNPISEDMLEAAGMLGIHFCVNILTDFQGKPFSVTCGSLERSHMEAVNTLKKHIALPLRKHPMIAVTTPGYPLNINLYQTIKAIIALAPVMGKNGVLVLYSRCTEGTGSVDMLRPFEEEKNLEGAMKFLQDNYRIQMDHSLLLCKILQTGLRIIFVSPNISPDIVRMMGLIPAQSLDSALEKALEMTGKEEKISFIPCPQRFLPYLGEDSL